MSSSLPFPMSCFIYSSDSSSFQPWNYAASAEDAEFEAAFVAAGLYSAP
jgi:hypothetical protein